MSNEFEVISLKQSNQFIVSPYTRPAHKSGGAGVITAIVATVSKGVQYSIRSKQPQYV